MMVINHCTAVSAKNKGRVLRIGWSARIIVIMAKLDKVNTDICNRLLPAMCITQSEKGPVIHPCARMIPAKMTSR